MGYGGSSASAEVVAAQAYLGVLFSLLGMAIITFLYRFADRDLFFWHSYVSIFLAYFSAIGLLLVLPMDLTLTRLRREADTLDTYQAYSQYGDTIIDIYKGLYWPMLTIGNVVLVVLEEYNESGYFSFVGKVVDAVMQISKQIIMATVAGLVFIILLAVESKADSMGVITMTVVALSNTYGLLAMAFLLGFGLMELPKQTWMAGNLVNRVKRVQSKAAHEYRRMDDASLDVSEIVGSINQTKSAISRKDNHMQACVDELLCDVPEGIRGAGGEAKLNKVTGQVTVHELASLRRTLHFKLRTYFCAKAKIESLKEECFFLEDVLTSFIKGDGYIVWLNGEETGTLRYLWEVWWKPLGLRVLGVAWLGLSVLVMLGELGLFVGAKSPIAGLTKACRESDLGNGSFTVIVLSSLGFLVYVLIFALFQLRLTNTMEIVGGKKTNRASLSFNARLFCQFAAPLAYNYLGLTLEAGPTIRHATWMDSAATGRPVPVSFTTFYGQMMVVPVIGDNINLVIPIFIMIVAALHGANVLNKALQLLRLGALQFGDIPISSEELKIGESKLKRAREVAQRLANRDQRVKHLSKGVGAILNMRIKLPTNNPAAAAAHGVYNLCRRKKRGAAPVMMAQEGDVGGEGHLSVDIQGLGDGGGMMMGDGSTSPANSTPGLSPAGSPTSMELKALDKVLGPKDPRILEKYAAMRLARAALVSKPGPHRGYAEKKAHKAIGGVVGRGWQRRFFVLEDPGRLCYFDLEEDVGLIDDPKWQVDVKDLGEPTLHTLPNGNVVGTRVDVPLLLQGKDGVDDVLKLRFKTEEEAMDWMMAIMGWSHWVQQQDDGRPRKTPPPPPLSTTSSSHHPESSSALAATVAAPPSPSSTTSSDAPSPRGGGRGSIFGMFMRTTGRSTEASSPPSPKGGGGEAVVVIDHESLQQRMAATVVPTPPTDGRPAGLSGWLGKKSSKHTQTWNERYFVVDRDSDESFLLQYYYGPELGQARGRFDLREAERVEAYSNKAGKKDPVRFVVVFRGRDNKLKLKGESQAQADQWREGLEAWIKYYETKPPQTTTMARAATPTNLLD